MPDDPTPADRFEAYLAGAKPRTAADRTARDADRLAIREAEDGPAMIRWGLVLFVAVAGAVALAISYGAPWLAARIGW